jgi:hypothetical protein
VTGELTAMGSTTDDVLRLPGCSFDFRKRFRRLMGYLKPIKALFVSCRFDAGDQRGGVRVRTVRSLTACEEQT